MLRCDGPEPRDAEYEYRLEHCISWPPSTASHQLIGTRTETVSVNDTNTNATLLEALLQIAHDLSQLLARRNVFRPLLESKAAKAMFERGLNGTLFGNQGVQTSPTTCDTGNATIASRLFVPFVNG